MKKKRVMMLCVGNHCRSPLAHTLLEKLVVEGSAKVEIEVDSSGLGDWHTGNLANSHTRENAQEHGITITHRSQMLKNQDIEDFDIIFSMDRSIHKQVLKRAPSKYHKKFYLFREFDSVPDNLDVPDPYYEGKFEGVYQIVERNCKIIFKKLAAKEL